MTTAVWDRAEARFVAAALGKARHAHRRPIAASLAMFGRLRRGAPFLAEIERRLWDAAGFRYAGSTIDHADPREIERIFVDAVQGRAVRTSDLTLRLSWIAADERDDSLRLRASYGFEQTHDWLTPDEARAAASDALFARLFPEAALLAECRAVRALLAAALPGPVRLSERIAYNNAPGGGALFHHDADPGQLGVVFAQLAGRTAWLAASTDTLLGALVRSGVTGTRRTAGSILRRAETDRQARAALDEDPRLTAALAAAGCLFVLGPGDAIVLPSPDPDRTCWHSVFALGRRPSLAHSFGIFPAAVAPPADGRYEKGR